VKTGWAANEKAAQAAKPTLLLTEFRIH